MNLDREDEKLESYLRQFRAHAPGPLPKERKQQKVRIAAIVAIAALILATLGFVALRKAQSNSHRVLMTKTVESRSAATEISMIRLSRFAQQDPDRLGAHLDRLSPRLLPDVRSGKGVLNHLAGE